MPIGCLNFALVPTPSANPRGARESRDHAGGQNDFADAVHADIGDVCLGDVRGESDATGVAKADQDARVALVGTATTSAATDRGDLAGAQVDHTHLLGLAGTATLDDVEYGRIRIRLAAHGVIQPRSKTDAIPLVCERAVA
eukprot:1415164-Prymnesium_polylepis.2